MAWIESHEDLRSHPKTIQLSDLMSWDIYHTIGRLQCFWWWCLTYAPSGDLTKWNNASIANGVGLNASESKIYVEAMVESRWICREPRLFRVHDWIDYAGRYLRDTKYRRHPEIWKEILAFYSIKCHCGSVSRQSADCQPTASADSVSRQSADPPHTPPLSSRPKNPPLTPPRQPTVGRQERLPLEDESQKRGGVEVEKQKHHDPNPAEAWETVQKSFDDARLRATMNGAIKRTIDAMGGHDELRYAFKEKPVIIRGQFLQLYRGFQGQ